jgi:hypothetical protein
MAKQEDIRQKQEQPATLNVRPATRNLQHSTGIVRPIADNE